MQRVECGMAILLAGLFAVGSGCSGDDAVASTAVAGDATGAHTDASQGGTDGMGGSTADVSKEGIAPTEDAATDTPPETSDASPSSETADVKAETPPVDAGGEPANESAIDAEIPDASDEPIADGADASTALSKICALGCATTDDCRADASASRLVCEPDSHRCVNCIDDLPCIAAASLWTAKSCAADVDCVALYGDYCVDVGGFGFCAFDKSKIGTSSCAPGNANGYVIARHGGGPMVEVCAKLTNTCDLRQGRCEGPCTINCTAFQGGKVCNATTQRCECASDDDCAAPIKHCNLVTRQCECSSASDCAPDGGSALLCK